MLTLGELHKYIQLVVMGESATKVDPSHSTTLI